MTAPVSTINHGSDWLDALATWGGGIALSCALIEKGFKYSGHIPNPILSKASNYIAKPLGLLSMAYNSVQAFERLRNNTSDDALTDELFLAGTVCAAASIAFSANPTARVLLSGTALLIDAGNVLHTGWQWNEGQITTTDLIIQTGFTLVFLDDSIADFKRFRKSTIKHDTQSNKELSYLRLIKYLTERPDLRPSDETLSLLRNHPGFVGTLTGTQLYWEIPQHTSPKAQAEITLLMDRICLATDRKLEIIEAPYFTPDRKFLTDLEGMKNVGAYEYTTEYLGDWWCSQHAGLDKTELLNAARIHEAKKQVDLLFSDQPMPRRARVPNTIRQVGMICYCRDDADIARFADVIKTWDENFALYGHNKVTLKIADDSPVDISVKIQQAIRQIRFRSSLKIEFFGKFEKEMIVEKISRRVLKSKAAIRLMSEHGISEAEIKDALKASVGGGGVAPNRNFSMLMLDKPGLQVDGDMTPESLIVWNTYTFHKDQKTLAVPNDALGYYEGLDEGTVSAPRYCGHKDREIPLIVEDMPALNAKGFGLSHHTGSQIVFADSFDFERQVLIHQHSGFEKHYPSSGLYLPHETRYGSYTYLQPSIRDGDIFTIDLMEDQHRPIEAFGPACLYHRDPTGQKWGGKPNLLMDSIVSQYAYMHMARAPKMPKDIETLGMAWLDISRAEINMDSRNMPAGIRVNILNEYFATACSFVLLRNEAVIKLSRYRATLENPSDVDGVTEVIQNWYCVGKVQPRELKEIAADSQKMQQIKMDLDYTIGVLTAERDQMVATFKIDADQLLVYGTASIKEERTKLMEYWEHKLEPQVRQIIKNYAISTLLWDEITKEFNKQR